MFRFTIRDVLWLMVVVGMGVVVWINQRATTLERAANAKLKRELDSRRASMDKEWSQLQKLAQQAAAINTKMFIPQYDLNMERTRFLTDEVTESDRERAKQQSVNLGAPQPKPLPPGYGEKPNAN